MVSFEVSRPALVNKRRDKIAIIIFFMLKRLLKFVGCCGSAYPQGYNIMQIL